jgi:outer membrane protein insertion porin family
VSYGGLATGLLMGLLCAALWPAASPSSAPQTHPVIVGARTLAHPGAEVDVEVTRRRLLRFADALDGQGIEVVSGYALQGSPLAHVAGEDPVDDLQAHARALGVPTVILLDVTRAADAARLELRVLRDHGETVLVRVAADVGPDERDWGEALDSLAARIRPALDQAPPPVRIRLAQAEPGSSFGAVAGEELVPEASRRVVELRIEGNRRIEADAIRAVLLTREGDRVRPRAIAGDVRRIYELGFFRDVQVFSTPLRGGQLITFQVEENPIIRQVSITGNEGLGADDIKDRLTITVGSTIDYPLLLENEQRIEGLYQSRGFYLADVTYHVEQLEGDAVSVDFEINEGKKLRLTSIDWQGNEAFSDRELMQVVTTKPWGLTSYVSSYWDNSGLYAEPLFFQDLDQVLRKYMDFGFIQVQVGEPKVSHDESGIEVAVRIKEGPQYAVGQLDVIGDDTIDPDQLMALLKMKTGDIFSRSALGEDVENVRSRYADRGFYEARVRPRTDVDPDRRTIDVVFEVEKGDLFFVDWIEVAGNTRTRDSVVRRQMGVAEGDLFSGRALDRSRSRVQRLGYFEEVTLDTEPTEPGKLGVTVDVVERQTGSFSLGAGFGSADGFLLNASISQQNLFGRGYAMSANVDLGSNNQFGFIRFTDPWFRGTAAALSLSGRFSKVDFDDFESEIKGFSIDLGYPLDEGETRGSMGYAYSGREITDINDNVASSLLQREEAEEETDTSILTFALRRDTRDDVRFPKEGQIWGLALETAGLGGLNKFIRFEGRLTRFIPARKWVGFESTFIMNSRIGYVIPLNDIGDFDLPDCDVAGCDGELALGSNGQIDLLENVDDDLELSLSERYFLGGLGAFQLRGFEQRTVGPRRTALTPRDLGDGNVLYYSHKRNYKQGTIGGPRCLRDPTANPLDPNNALGDDECNDIDDEEIDDFEDLDLTDIIGGNKMFLLNLELQFPLSEELGLTGILFFDTGNAFDETETMNPLDFRFATGMGVQWFSPFGPILVTLGVPLDPEDDEDGSVFEFSLGGQQY